MINPLRKQPPLSTVTELLEMTQLLCSIAGILYTSSISDHYPYFLSLNRSINRGNQPPSRYVKQRVDTESPRAAYLGDIINSDIISQLNQDPYCDPNINYDILQKYITDLKDKQLPFRLVKFNKFKHKGNKWITKGALKSLKYKDRLYKQLRFTDKSSNLHPYLKQKFGLYNSLVFDSFGSFVFILFSTIAGLIIQLCIINILCLSGI